MQVLQYEVSKHLSMGACHQSVMTFANRTLAHKWKAGILRNIKLGKLDYKLIGFRFIGSKTI
jgi:hypothetical protein